MAAVNAGFDVIGIDLDATRVEAVSAGDSPISGLPSSELRRALDSGRYRISDSYTAANGFDYAVITVPTPLRDGEPDLSFIQSAAESVAPLVKRGATVILESTTYPGTTAELLAPILTRGSPLTPGEDFSLGYSPERIDPGNPTWNLLNTPKVVSGLTEGCRDRVAAFYIALGISVVEVGSTRVAELTKLLENTFRHVNIALVNELAVFSNFLGVDIWEAIEAAETKPFGFMKFLPGPGVGGHCLPVDPSYLSWAIKEKSGAEFEFVKLANRVNSQMPDYVVSRANELLRDHRRKTDGVATVLLYGIAYKPNTSDLRESPALVIAAKLQEFGIDVCAIDNLVSDTSWPSQLPRATEADLSRYDLGILVTNQPHGRPEHPLVTCDQILDTRREISGANVHYL